jgi:hypothetical protein
MIQQRPEIAAYLVAALCIIGMIVLTFHGDTVPDTLNFIAAGALGIGGGVTVSGGGSPPAIT